MGFKFYKLVLAYKVLYSWLHSIFFCWRTSFCGWNLVNLSVRLEQPNFVAQILAQTVLEQIVKLPQILKYNYLPTVLLTPPYLKGSVFNMNSPRGILQTRKGSFTLHHLWELGLLEVCNFMWSVLLSELSGFPWGLWQA